MKKAQLVVSPKRGITSQHPDTRTLIDFVLNEIQDSKLRNKLGTHLKNCEKCRKLVRIIAGLNRIFHELIELLEAD